MTIIESIVELINAAAIPEITGGTNKVFQYEMPDPVDIGVLVIPVPSSFLTREDTPGYFTGEFMVVIRHNTISGAMALAELVAVAVDQRNADTTDHEIKRVRPTNLPFPFPRSTGDKYEAMIQCAIAYAER